MLPDALRTALADHVDGTPEAFTPVGGGCIANGGQLTTSGGTYFLKWGRGAVADTLPAEAEGLRALRATGSGLVVPEPLAWAAEAPPRPGYLLMTWIETGRVTAATWHRLGEGLVQLHHTTAGRYGFDGANYIGRTPQENGWCNTWPTFFRTRRLEPQVDRARRAGRWDAAWDRDLDALYGRLDDLLPADPPASLVHGDLWSGNMLATATGEAAIIDPAVYFGHREVDLAMTELFGGFADGFYDAYRAAWPLAPGYGERRTCYNLYHLLNHLNLFGRSYAGQVGRALRRLA